MARPWASPSWSPASSIIGQGRLSSHSGRKSESNVVPDGQNAPLHICKKSGRGSTLLRQLEREGEAQERRGAATTPQNFVFHFPLLAPWAPRENRPNPTRKTARPGPKRSHVSSGLFRCLEMFFKCPGPELSSVSAGGASQPRATGCDAQRGQLGPQAFPGPRPRVRLRLGSQKVTPLSSLGHVTRTP